MDLLVHLAASMSRLLAGKVQERIGEIVEERRSARDLKKSIEDAEARDERERAVKGDARYFQDFQERLERWGHARRRSEKARILSQRSCAQCSSEFPQESPTHPFCSDACSEAFYSATRTP